MRKVLVKFYDFFSSWTGTVIFVLFVMFFLAQAFVIPSGSMKNTLLIGDFLFAKKFSYGIPIPRIPWLEIPILPDFNGNGHLIEGNKPQRGDIVIFRNPKNDKVHFVKRLFATGEDEVIFTPKAIYLHFKEGNEFIENHYGKEDIVNLSGKLYVKEPYKFKGIHYDEKVNILNYVLAALNANEFAMEPIFINEFKTIGDLPFNAFYYKVPKDEFFMIGDNRDHSNDSRFWGSVGYENIVGKPWFVYFSWDKNYKIRWDRIGRFSSSLESSKDIVDAAIAEEEVNGLH